eukprot:403353021
MDHKLKTSKKFGQYFNFAGVQVFLKALLFNREYFIPHLAVKNINNINFKLLHQNGIKYVVFDKDNTLTNAYEKDINPQIQDGYNQCKEVFGLQNMAILSNSVGSTDDKDHQEAKLLEQITGIPVIRHKLKKPLVKDDIYLHFNLPLSQQKSTSNQQSNSPIALIGDRILADTVMGNSHGFFTIDVRPFSTKNENIMVKMSRKVEEYVLPIVCRGKQAPEHQIFQHVKREDLIK